MEIFRFAVETFDGNTLVGIYNRRDDPLFCANEIGGIIGMKNIKPVMSYITDTDKVIRTISNRNKKYGLTFLTKAGLYRLLAGQLKGKLIIRRFMEWVMDIIEELGQDDWRDDDMIGILSRLDVLEDENEKLRNKVNKINKQPIYIPNDKEYIPRHYKINLERFIGHFVYLIYLGRRLCGDEKNQKYENLYKFGLTDGVARRFAEHEEYYNKRGPKIIFVTAWKCRSEQMTRDVERFIINASEQDGNYIKYTGRREIFMSDDVRLSIDMITDHVRHIDR